MRCRNLTRDVERLERDERRGRQRRAEKDGGPAEEVARERVQYIRGDSTILT